jgi:hypothetical protein
MWFLWVKRNSKAVWKMDGDAEAKNSSRRRLQMIHAHLSSSTPAAGTFLVSVGPGGWTSRFYEAFEGIVGIFKNFVEGILLSVICYISFQQCANPCMSIDEQGSLCGVLLGCGSMYGCGTIGREGCGAIGEAANCCGVSSWFSYLKP